ncbi:cytochrome c3 family protein [Sulfurimonas sp.]|uniref:cytochrome c3 family protein n=1 Tax=Sulfurimonas sp. TaxID=2022749 RepID=UPI0019E85DCB|nr:cytochrome c3 family protein [Sulfurimonas sp.]MBE0514630.1 hypothetical protein [Sulfurimonas sp.]
MRPLNLFAKAVLTLSIFFMSAFAEGSFVQIITPKENTLQTELTLNVVLGIDKKHIDAVEVGVFPDMKSLDLSRSENTACVNISLGLGENRVLVRAYKESALVSEESRSVYVSSQLYHQFRYPPKDYKKSYFHNDENEKLCSKCHDMSVNEVENIAFVDVTKSNCYGCHKNINREKYAHAPSANWLCTSCHKQSRKGASKYLTKEPMDAACFECHKENQELWSSAKYRHEPLDAGHCDKCHNPHSAPYNMFIRKDVNEICLGCHKDKHIKARESKNSACAGTSYGDLCIECHTPHASNRPFFLKKRFDEVKK